MNQSPVLDLTSMATLYVALLTAVITLVPLFERYAPFFAKPVRFLRYTTVSIIVRIFSELWMRYGNQFISRDVQGLRLVLWPVPISFSQGIELGYSILIMFLLGSLLPYLFELERATTIYRQWKQYLM